MIFTVFVFYVITDHIFVFFLHTHIYSILFIVSVSYISMYCNYVCMQPMHRCIRVHMHTIVIIVVVIATVVIGIILLLLLLDTVAATISIIYCY